jgi:hypothetical protein
VEKEQSPSAQPGLRPADILILFPAGPAAIDFTVWTRLHDSFDELDKAVRDKRRVYGAVCTDEGWLFKPWGADTYGGLHPGARALTSLLAKHLEDAGKGGLADVSQMVWRAVVTAVIHRAAAQLARHVPPPPVGIAELVESDEDEEEPSENIQDGEHTSDFVVMGNNTSQPDRNTTDAPSGSLLQDLPSPMEADGETLAEQPVPSPVWTESGSATAPSPHPPPPPDLMEGDSQDEGHPPGDSVRVMGRVASIRVGVALPSGAVLPVVVPRLMRADELKSRILLSSGLPLERAHTFALAWGHVRLGERQTLAEADVQDSDMLSLVSVTN